MALKNDPGFLASSALHGTALVFMLLHFFTAPTFEDAQESVAVETISTSELNAIMNGEKTAKQMPVPQRRVEKVAASTESKPLPPLAEAKKDVTRDAPDKPRDDPGQDDKPIPTPPQRVAALPPEPVPEPKPEPVPPSRPPEAAATPIPAPPQRPTPEPPKLAETPPPEDAEALEPKPIPRPKIEPKKEVKAEPAPLPTPVVKPPEKKIPPVKEAKVPEPPKKIEPPKKVEPRFKPAELAKLLADPKPVEKPVDPKPPVKPKAGNEAKEPPTRVFNPASISAMLDHDTPQRKASTGQKLTQMASLGAPNAHASTLSPSMLGQLSEYFQGQYLSCWTYFGLASSDGYVPVVRVQLSQDGILMGRPILVNQPADPNQRSLADSALRAVQKCSPMKVPDRFSPYFDRWHDQIIKFDRKALL